MLVARVCLGLLVASVVVWFTLKMFSRPATPKTRLTAAQAIELATRALEDDPRPWPREQVMATVQERSGALVWVVAPLVKGWALSVEIDDRTGEVLSVSAGGVR